MLLYFSSEKNVDIFNNQGQELGIQIDVVVEQDFIGYIEANRTKLNHLEFLAIDLENIFDDELQIIKSLSAFRLCNSNVKIIVVGIGREKGDTLLGRFFAEGIYNFVTSKDEEVREREIKDCFENANSYISTIGYRVENFETSKINDKNSVLSNFLNNIKKTNEKIYKRKEEKVKNNKKEIKPEKPKTKAININSNIISKEDKEEPDNNIFIEFIEDTKVINYFGKIIGIVENNIAIIDKNFEKNDNLKSFCKINNLNYIFKSEIMNSLETVNKKEQKENNQNIEKIIEVEKVVEKKVIIKPKINKIKIAVCGTCPRMGTTTQAFLIANYFSKYGFKSCYLEFNSKDAIKNIKNFYNVFIDEENKKITSEKIDIFYNITFEDFPKILTMDYEVFIFDYGDFLQTNEESFASADFRIVVCGAKAWEEEYIQNVFKICDIYRDINFIFSFVDEEEQEFILKNMGELNVYFSEYCPNIFKIGNEKIYNKIFKNYVSIE